MTALKQLVKYELISFKAFNKGTIATLLNTNIYDINTGDSIYCKNKNLKHETRTEGEKPSKFSIENTQKEPPENHPKTTCQPLENQHKTNHDASVHQELCATKPLTNKETMENENKQTTTVQSSAIALYPCLKEFDRVKGFRLSDDEKLGLMAYPIDRVAKAIDYASHPSVPIKKDLISLLHWHCKMQSPVAAPDKSDFQASSIPQHKLAYEYSEFLKECGFLKQYEANFKSILGGTKKVALEPIIKAKISKNKTIEEKIKRLRQRAANTNDDSSFDEFQEQIAALEKELTSMPTYPQLWTSDITSEHLGTLMAQNEEAMSILSDEGGIFDIIGGPYSNGRANIDLLLQSHSGGPVRIDRGSKPPIFLKRVLTGMGITVQPEVVKRVCKNKTFRGRGLLGRFLYVMPTSNIGFRTLEEEPMDESVRIHYHDSIMTILNHPYDMTNGVPHQHILKFEPEAYLKWLEYSKMIEMMMGRDLDFLSHITDWAGKLSGQIARIAALLHIYRYAFEKPEERSISVQDIQGAIKIGHVLTRHALKVFDLIHEDDAIEVAKDILKWITDSNLEQFTQRECGRKFRIYQKHKLLQGGLNILKKGGYLHEWKYQPPKGPDSIMFDVNPKYKNIDMGQMGQEGQ